MKLQTIQRIAFTALLGLTVAASPAFAQEETYRLPDFMMKAVTNKDGVVTRDEFIKAMGMYYDMNLAKAKQMPEAETKKYVKNNSMTMMGVRKMIDALPSYTGA